MREAEFDQEEFDRLQAKALIAAHQLMEDCVVVDRGGFHFLEPKKPLWRWLLDFVL